MYWSCARHTPRFWRSGFCSQSAPRNTSLPSLSGRAATPHDDASLCSTRLHHSSSQLRQVRTNEARPRYRVLVLSDQSVLCKMKNGAVTFAFSFSRLSPVAVPVLLSISITLSLSVSVFLSLSLSLSLCPCPLITLSRHGFSPFPTSLSSPFLLATLSPSLIPLYHSLPPCLVTSRSAKHSSNRRSVSTTTRASSSDGDMNLSDGCKVRARSSRTSSQIVHALLS